MAELLGHVADARLLLVIGASVIGLGAGMAISVAVLRILGK